MTLCQPAKATRSGELEEPSSLHPATSAALPSCSGRGRQKPPRMQGQGKNTPTLFSKEPAAQMERQDRHLRTLKPPLRQLRLLQVKANHQQCLCEAVSPLIQPPFTKGSQLCFISFPLTILFSHSSPFTH